MSNHTNFEAILRSNFIIKLIFGSLILIWVLSYFRIFFGADVTDEAQYVASAYLPSIGGKPFFNELYIQQTASLLYAPFVWLYSFVFGSLTGIILAIRHLYFIFAGLTAYSAYRYFQATCDRLQSFALSTLFITFIPFCIPSLSYNTIGYLGINCFFIWSAISLRSPRLTAGILSGAFASLSVWSYPTLCIPVVIFYMITCLFFFKDRTILRKILSSACTFGLIMILTLPLLLLAGLENLEMAFNFSRASGAGGGFEKITYAFQTLFSTLPPVQILVPFVTFWIFFARWKKLSSVWLFSGLTILYISFCLSANSRPTTIFASHLHLWFLSQFAVVICLCAWWSARKSDFPLGVKFLLPLVISAFIGSLVLTATSSMTFYPAIYPLVFVLLLAFKEFLPAGNRVAILYLILINVATLGLSYSFVYRDDSVENLGHLIQEGPYAGILTSEARDRLLNEIQTDINSLAKAGNSILFFDSFPAGYLMSSKLPATRSLFMHPLPTYSWLRPFYADYYLDVNHQPDIIFDFKFIDFSNQERVNFHYPDETFSGDFLRLALYQPGFYKKIIQRESYSVYLRNK